MSIFQQGTITMTKCGKCQTYFAPDMIREDIAICYGCTYSFSQRTEKAEAGLVDMPATFDEVEPGDTIVLDFTDALNNNRNNTHYPPDAVLRAFNRYKERMAKPRTYEDYVRANERGVDDEC